MYIFNIVDSTWMRRTKKKNYPILDRKLIFLELLHLGNHQLATTVFNIIESNQKKLKFKKI